VRTRGGRPGVEVCGGREADVQQLQTSEILFQSASSLMWSPLRSLTSFQNCQTEHWKIHKKGVSNGCLGRLVFTALRLQTAKTRSGPKPGGQRGSESVGAPRL
jgi:hypothetical protein